MDISATEDGKLLQAALRQPGFRFMLISHNHRNVVEEIANWLQRTYPDRSVSQLSFRDRSYRGIFDALSALENRIVMIPDFDYLFQEGQEALCVAFNQRRDFVASRKLALLCFLRPDSLSLVAKRLPDWWSLRSLEVEFITSVPTTEIGEFLTDRSISSSFSESTKEQKEAELARLESQLELADGDNVSLQAMLHDQIGTIAYELAQYEKAKAEWEKAYDGYVFLGERRGEVEMLNNLGLLASSIGNHDLGLAFLSESLIMTQIDGFKKEEALTLNNLGTIHYDQEKYEEAWGYFTKSLTIYQELKDKKGEAAALNNLASVAQTTGKYETALIYLQKSLELKQSLRQAAESAPTLNNLSQLFFARGENEQAISYLFESLKITRKIGDRKGEGIALGNLSRIYLHTGKYEPALESLKQSLAIAREIGKPYEIAVALHNQAAILFQQMNQTEYALPLFLEALSLFQQADSPKSSRTKSFLTDLHQQLGSTRFQQLVSEWQTTHPEFAPLDLDLEL